MPKYGEGDCNPMDPVRGEGTSTGGGGGAVLAPAAALEADRDSGLRPISNAWWCATTCCGTGS